MLTRRDFLQTTAAAAAFAMTSPGGAAPWPLTPSGSIAPCAGLSSISPKTIPPRWIAPSGSTTSVASTPTALPLRRCESSPSTSTKIRYHHRNKWLPGNESFYAEMVDGCSKQNIVVLARTDPHATYQDVYEAHPDWISVDANGKSVHIPTIPACGSPALLVPTISTS